APSARPGTTSQRALPLSSTSSAEHPPPFLEQLVSFAIEIGERHCCRLRAARGRFATIEDVCGDLLPLGNFRQRCHRLVLRAERREVRIGADGRRVPRAAPCRKITSQLEELDLLRRLGKKLDELARGDAVL